MIVRMLLIILIDHICRGNDDDDDYDQRDGDMMRVWVLGDSDRDIHVERDRHREKG